ncbi:hypothetical protein COC96_26485 [Bacillus cereus]|nr:hypothetical protein COC96_26485 [Bacillus cereus]
MKAVRQVQLLVQVVLPKSSFLVCSAWRHAHTCRISECKEKGGRFFEWVSQKILSVPCMEKSPIRRYRRGISRNVDI